MSDHDPKFCVLCLDGQHHEPTEETVSLPGHVGRHHNWRTVARRMCTECGEPAERTPYTDSLLTKIRHSGEAAAWAKRLLDTVDMEGGLPRVPISPEAIAGLRVIARSSRKTTDPEEAS